MESVELRTQVSGYLDEYKNTRGKFISSIKKAFHQGKLDHNYIRKAVIECFEQHDKNAILFGSLLLQLDNDEIRELLHEKIVTY